MIDLETVTAAAVIIAVVQAFKETLPKYVNGLTTMGVALLAGILVGWVGIEHLTIQDGIVAALVAIGGHTLVSSASSDKK